MIVARGDLAAGMGSLVVDAAGNGVADGAVEVRAADRV